MRKLGRKKANREHLLRNLATSLVLYESINTTEDKAKELKSFLEKIIARSKQEDLSTIKSAYATFFDKNAVDKDTLYLSNYKIVNRCEILDSRFVIVFQKIDSFII